MIRAITCFALFICSLLSAQSQYEQGMQKAFELWSDEKNTEALAMFERIAAAEKNNWLPGYYVALMNTTQAFGTKDKDKLSALLGKAQAAQDKIALIAPDNAEVMVMQALIYTAWISADPMSNGMNLSGKVKELYAKASKIAPDNPRVVFSKAEFEMGSAAYFKQDTKPMCEQIEKAIGLFATYKSPGTFHPKWGLERAQEAAKNCKK